MPSDMAKSGQLDLAIKVSCPTVKRFIPSYLFTVNMNDFDFDRTKPYYSIAISCQSLDGLAMELITLRHFDLKIF